MYNAFFKENQFKRKLTRYIDLNLTIFSFIFNYNFTGKHF